MLHDDYQDTLFGGVALKDHTLDSLKEQKNKLTGKIIYQTDLAAGMRCSKRLEFCSVCKDRQLLINNTQQDLDIIESEIESRYENMKIFA